MLNSLGLKRLCRAVVFAGAAVAGGSASANTINQNTSWTINRSGATSTYRVAAYGDSIFAGYNGSLFSVAKRAAPLVDGEYLAKQWGANVEVVRRTKSGAIASDIYDNKIIAERSYMQSSNTRVVTFEMCGNDYLQARSNLSNDAFCNYGLLDTALANCTAYTEKAMQAINQYATTAKVKIVTNLYYPGYDADNTAAACLDSNTWQPPNKQALFLPYLAHSNWRTCNLAAKYGFQCADAFAQFMGADYDANNDGVIDSDALKYKAGESESAYVARITGALRGTIRDANGHLANASTSYDLIQSDNTHPTYLLGTISTGSGSGAPDFADSQIVGGKNPSWNSQGHERMGWANSVFGPSAP